MTQENKRPDIIDLFAMRRDQRNAVPAQRARRIDLAQIRARIAALDPGELDQMVEDVEKIRVGLEAFDLAHEYLAAGKLDRARHWLIVAAEHDIDGSDALLADVTAIQEALDDPQTPVITTGTALGRDDTAAEQQRQAKLVDEVHETGAMLRRAREQAQTIERKAENLAKEILAEARNEADTRREVVLLFEGPPDPGLYDQVRLLPHVKIHYAATDARHVDILPGFSLDPGDTAGIWLANQETTGLACGKTIGTTWRDRKTRTLIKLIKFLRGGGASLDNLMLLSSACHEAIGEPPRWDLAADAFDATATTLDNYAEMLRWAQGQAREAIRLWNEGDTAAAAEALRQAVGAVHDEATFRAAEATSQGAINRNEFEAARRVLADAWTARFRLRGPDSCSYGSRLAGRRLWTPRPSDWTGDLMVTDLAPVDLVLQRLGRLHRHDGDGPSAEQGPERQQIVAGPRFRQAIDELHEQLGAAGA